MIGKHPTSILPSDDKSNARILQLILDRPVDWQSDDEGEVEIKWPTIEPSYYVECSEGKGK